MASAVRKIIHVDMDAFYASVEQRDDPALRGRPVAVGGRRRGVVMAASYEARKFGVRSAMPSATAQRRCPDIVFVRPRMEVYGLISRQIREIFRSYSDLVEPLSLDEAYLDVTQPTQGPASGTLLARQIKRDILEATGLTASAGVSFNKFLAKVASGLDKPDGLTVIRPEEAAEFIAALPIDRFFGVGRVTAERMKKLGIKTGADLQALDEAELVRRFGKVGRHFFRIVRGLDDRPVSPNRRRKSVGAERTFLEDISDVDEMETKLEEIAESVARRLERVGARGRTVTLKIKYHDFIVRTRSRTLPAEIGSSAEIAAVGRQLLHAPIPPDRSVRLLGLTVSNLDNEPREEDDHQLRLL
ncbi:MAG: DNA polymerase IV [Rhodothermales bacterium]|nr:DNA polymerase IV [Rhodothermales bacterium]